MANDIDATNPIVLDLLSDVLSAVQQIQRSVDALRAERQRSHMDATRTFLERLVPICASVFGASPFTSAELVAHRSPDLQLVIGTRSAGAIGCALGPAAKHQIPIGDLLVEKVKKEHGCSVFVVRRVI